MFLAWSFFEMFFFLFFFQVLLSSALGATLAFYSRFCKGYAHSLRWMYQGDFLEMIKIVWLSLGKKLPSNISRALWITLTLSILVNVIEIAVKAFVNESIQGVDPSYLVNKRYQLMNLNWDDVLPGWEISLDPNSNLQNSLIRTINSTRNIRNPVPGRIYSPRRLPYQVLCSSLNLIVLNRNLALYPNLYSPNNGCANVSIAISELDFLNYSATVITRRADTNSVKVVGPGNFSVMNVAVEDQGYGTYTPYLSARVDYQNNTCFIGTDTGNGLMYNDTGINSSPQTAVSKCIFSSGHVTTMSVTSVRYSVPDVKAFGNISESVFRSFPSKLLVLAMQDSITDGTLLSLSSNDTLSTISVMEIYFSETKIDLLRCNSRRAGIGGNIYLSCMYNILTTIFAEPQPMMPEIVDLRGVNRSFPIPPNFTVAIAFTHLPNIGGLKGTLLTFDTDSILNQSTSVAQYFASLGQNFFMDWTDGALYTVFDTVDLRKGYEIPVGLFGVVIATMTFCLILWIAAEVSLDVRYKGSMLWVLTNEMKTYLNRPTPTIVKVDPDLLVVEGIPLVAKVELLNLKEEYEEE